MGICSMKMKLAKLANVNTGYSFRSRIQTYEEGVSVIQMKDLPDNNTIKCNGFVKTDIEDVKERHLVKKGDLVFRSRGHIYTSAVILDDPGRAIIAAPLLRIRVKRTGVILPEYLNWFISQYDAQTYLNSRAKGTGQKMISKQVLEDLEVSFPGLENQKKIVEISSLFASEQNLLHKLADKREQYVAAILRKFAKGD